MIPDEKPFQETPFENRTVPGVGGGKNSIP